MSWHLFLVNAGPGMVRVRLRKKDSVSAGGPGGVGNFKVKEKFTKKSRLRKKGWWKIEVIRGDGIMPGPPGPHANQSRTQQKPIHFSLRCLGKTAHYPKLIGGFDDPISWNV
jgi:hypothetical protein